MFPVYHTPPILSTLCFPSSVFALSVFLLLPSFSIPLPTEDKISNSIENLLHEKDVSFSIRKTAPALCQDGFSSFYPISYYHFFTDRPVSQFLLLLIPLLLSGLLLFPTFAESLQSPVMEPLLLPLVQTGITGINNIHHEQNGELGGNHISLV